MKKCIKIEYVVGWSTKQANTNIRRTTNYFDENEFEKAYAKYLIVSNRDRVIFAYLNKRTEYDDGSVCLKRIYCV